MPRGPKAEPPHPTDSIFRGDWSRTCTQETEAQRRQGEADSIFPSDGRLPAKDAPDSRPCLKGRPVGPGPPVSFSPPRPKASRRPCYLISHLLLNHLSDAS
jgi:hypothetical protein